MGVRQLETFIKKYVDGGFVKVSIKEACLEYQREHNELPILVFDFLGFIGMLTKNDEDTLCGGRFNKYKETFEELLRNLSQFAKLVFFEDGKVGDLKLPVWIKRHSAKYNLCMNIMQKINEGQTLRRIIEEHPAHHEIPKVTTQTEMMEFMAKKYGELMETHTRECDSEIARYAYNNPKVLAVVGDDSDFLIYPGHWRYFSIKNINFDLETMEYKREVLRSYFNLNDEGMKILSTLNGNDIIKYDELQKTFHLTLHLKHANDARGRFNKLAKETKRLLKLPSERLVEKIAQMTKHSRELIEESLKMYDPNFDILEPTDDVFKFCRDNLSMFTYAVYKKSPMNFTCAYIDLSDDLFYEVKLEIFEKQVGIVLANHPYIRDSKYEVVTKQRNLEDYRSEFIKPVILADIPPLLELLDRSNFPEHDAIRFQLLRYMVGCLRLKNYDLSTFPPTYLQDILTLVILRHHKFIEQFEADLIMLTIKHVEEGKVPNDLRAPPQLNEKAFRTSFLFSKFHMFLDRCLQVVGLKEYGKFINFDGVLFHNLYLEYLKRPYKIELMLGDLTIYRIYK